MAFGVLNAQGHGVSILQKPEKIFLENTNLAFALTQHPVKRKYQGDVYAKSVAKCRTPCFRSCAERFSGKRN